MANPMCRGTVYSTGEPCGNHAMDGQVVCRFHGGAAPQNRAAGARRVAQAKTEAVLLKALADAPPLGSIGDVYEELLQVAGVAKSWREILQARVGELQSLGYRGEHAEQVRADVQLFERALDRSAKVGDAIARLNLEERKQALDERTAGLVAQCITAVLNDLELTPEQRLLAKASAPKRLREISA